ncbi:thiamine diphosphokinase [Exiguobacterium sp.]|uniref:thiamine diphosphokinase n=1 Tax=Exiguobacterium sp. TaxID=44751 RepID=UPI0028AAE831|nr:thiamine diphosphokinase [Exiguobacterium sp.]
MRAILVCAGPQEEVPDLRMLCQSSDFIIGVDGGVQTIELFGLTCDMTIGDFDSLGYVPEGAIVHPAEKDETDLELALRTVSEMKRFDDTIIVGATGGRLDMTVQNVYLLKQYPEARLLTKREEVRYLAVGSYAVEAESYHYLSFIPLVPSILSLAGVKYPLDMHPVPVGGSLTVSNEWSTSEATVELHQGELLMMRTLKE